MTCLECKKDQPSWAFKGKEVCIFCDQSQVEIKPVEKKGYEEVEDNGCAGGACTL